MAEIAHLDWEKKWARNFCLLSCSYLGYDYYACKDLWQGRTFAHVLFRQIDNITTVYQLCSENSEIGNYLAGLISGNPELVTQWAQDVRDATDTLLHTLEMPVEQFEDADSLKQFEKQVTDYLPLYVRFTRIANVMPEEMREKHLALMDEIRLYTDPVYDKIDEHMRNVTAHIEQQAGYAKGSCGFLLRHEFRAYFEDKTLPSQEELVKRQAGCGLLFVDGKETLLTIDEVESLLNQIFKIDENVTELKGSPASPGIVKGKVTIVLDPSKADNFSEGDILVAEMTHPQYLQLMKQSAAIVTDAGGTLCHAAVVSREFNIPCVVGTQVATSVLKDGMMVEVDAEKGVVKILEK